MKKQDNVMHVKCFDCQTLLPSESASSKEEAPCPECGSVRKDITLSFEEEMPMHDAIRGKVKDSNMPSRDNPRIDFFSGDDLRKKDNKWMKKSRTIDKNNNLYKETVIDPETNEIVHHCEELLSNHQGHGKAKVKKDEKQ
jgi:DNA-directed RNA polymerase subunit RPC12/RpoP